MTEPSSYPRGLIWRTDGHVSDWVLSALLDGEDDLLLEEAVTHADSCEECAARLGLMASAAFAVGEDLRLWSEGRTAELAPFPARTFGAVALLIAFSGVALIAARGPAWLELPHKLITFWRWGRALAPWASERLDTLTFAFGWLGVLLLVAAGLTVAKRASLSSEQGSSS
jgi:hypothetical protein